MDKPAIHGNGSYQCFAIIAHCQVADFTASKIITDIRIKDIVLIGHGIGGRDCLPTHDACIGPGGQRA
ncbi:MAG: hypothetical protein NTU91_15485, partial [Chloroflexi bacterium]|nr:hypothetical protein [Chloroflexota bacterium]